jgi:hypothetical protein
MIPKIAAMTTNGLLRTARKVQTKRGVPTMSIGRKGKRTAE